MAYKYTQGSVRRGDIYNEDDTQSNTYLDWSEDAIGVIAGGSTVFVVSGSTALVGIGTTDPDYTLDVAGNIGLDEYIYHNGDADTFIRFQDDDITIKAGNINCISFTSASQSQLICNDGRDDLDFIVRSPSQNLALYLNAGNEVFHINHGESSFKTKIHSTNGEAITVNNSGVILNEDGAAANDFRVESDSNTHMLFVDAGNETVGIGTSSPASTLGVDGSVGAKISSITGTSNTIGATYTILMGSDDGVCAAQLPAAADCTGRIYIFKRLGSAACKVQSNGSEKIENSTDDLELETQYDAYTIQSDGTEWWILGEWYNG